MDSAQNNLNKQDIKDWVRNTLIFSVAIPVSITFLTSLQGKLDFKIAMGAGIQALSTALIDLLIKYKAGEVKN